MTNEELRRLIHAATNKCEAFNDFAQWAHFASDTIRENIRDEQVKAIKYNHLIANLTILHNVQSMTKIFRKADEAGIKPTQEILSVLSPYRTAHIRRFGAYELRNRTVDALDFNPILAAQVAS